MLPRGASRAKIPSLVAISIFAGLAGMPAIAHIEDNLNGVHFNNNRPDFGTVPTRAIISEEQDDRPSLGGSAMTYADDRAYVELTLDKDDWISYRHAKQRQILMQRASSALAAGRVRDAEADYSEVGHVFGWEQGVRTRVHILQLAEQNPASCLADVDHYNSALDADEASHGAAAAVTFGALARGSRLPWIKAYSLYQAAGLAYENRSFPAAYQGFCQVLEGWNDAPLREDTLIMVARSALQSGHENELRLPQAQWALQTLKRDFPKSRFLGDATGLEARIDTLRGNYPPALTVYFKRNDLASVEQILKLDPKVDRNTVRPRLLAAYFDRLPRARTYEEYCDAVNSIDRVRESFSLSDATTFGSSLPNRPVLAASYLYYRLYLTDASADDFHRLASLAGRLAQRWTNSSTSPSLAAMVCTRVAEAYYQDRDYVTALRWSRRALEIQPADRSQFVEGACLLKRGNPASAASILKKLLTAYPESPLRRAAREELALASERIGDLTTALDQYFALGYTTDIAYMLDARLTFEQVRQYEEAHRRSADHPLLLYTLGMRCLRDERYHEANHYFAELPRRLYRKYIAPTAVWSDDGAQQEPMTTAADLQRLEDNLNHSGGYSRAVAEYRYASYFYEHGTLLLYNGALWQGNRVWGFGYWWDPNVALPADVAAARRHMYEHEVYARAMALCLDVVRRYPHAPIAPSALYRAACCARRLSDFNDWWRGEACVTGLWWQSVALMKRVARDYPQSPLAHHARKYAGVFAGEAEEYGGNWYASFRNEWGSDPQPPWRE